jgi:hypothetical protein
VVFTVQPINTAAATSITPAIEVTARDAEGNTATSFTGDITLSISTNPGGSTLTGGGPVAAVAGVATFPGVSLNKIGVNYQLSAGAAGLASGSSALFNITPGAPFALTFSSPCGCPGQPTDATAGSPITTGDLVSLPVRVTALDAGGNIAPQFTGNVTIVISANPGGGTLSGTTVRAAGTAIAGATLFDDLSINRVGLGYRLGASATGLVGATSVPFNINLGPAAQLAFVVQPTDELINVAMTPIVRVDVLDSQGNRHFPYVGTITLTLTNPDGAILTAGGPVTVTDGFATFPGLRVDKVGTYTLTATSGSLANGVSTTFNITSVASLQ